jgi:hypothetical protein
MSQLNLFEDERSLFDPDSSSGVAVAFMHSKQACPSGNSSLRLNKEAMALFEDDDSIDELVAIKISSLHGSKLQSHDQRRHALFDPEDRDAEEVSIEIPSSVPQSMMPIGAKSTKNVQITNLRGNLFDDEEGPFPVPAADPSKLKMKPPMPVVNVSKSLFDEDDEESMFESKYYEERALRIQLESKVVQLESKLALLENKLFKYEPDFDWKDVRIPAVAPRLVTSPSKRPSLRFSFRGSVDLLPGQDELTAAASPSASNEAEIDVTVDRSSNIDNDDDYGDSTESSLYQISETAIRRQRRYGAAVGAKSARRRNLRSTVARNASTDPAGVSSGSKLGDTSLEHESAVVVEDIMVSSGPVVHADMDPLSSATGEACSDSEQPESQCERRKNKAFCIYPPLNSFPFVFADAADDMDPTVMAQCLVQTWSRGKDIVAMLRTFKEVYLDTDKLPDDLLYPTINTANDVRKTYLYVSAYMIRAVHLSRSFSKCHDYTGKWSDIVILTSNQRTAICASSPRSCSQLYRMPTMHSALQWTRSPPRAAIYNSKKTRIS